MEYDGWVLKGRDFDWLKLKNILQFSDFIVRLEFSTGRIPSMRIDPEVFFNQYLSLTLQGTYRSRFG